MKWHSIKRSSTFFQIFWYFSSHLATWESHEELRPAEAKPSSKGWCGDSQEVLVKRSVPWRNYSHICYCASRVRVLSSLPTTASLGGHGDIPCAFVLPWGELMWWRSPECCGQEMQVDFRIVVVSSSHHQGCDEGSCWITERKSFS